MTTDSPGRESVKLSPDAKHHLIRLNLEAQVAKKELELAKVKWVQAQAASNAAGDAARARMGVPQDAEDVTIDLDEGVIHYSMPVSQAADSE